MAEVLRGFGKMKGWVVCVVIGTGIACIIPALSGDLQSAFAIAATGGVFIVGALLLVALGTVFGCREAKRIVEEMRERNRE